MKRLGLYVCILVMLIGMVDGFLVPQKAIALVSEQEYTNSQGYSKDIDRLYDDAFNANLKPLAGVIQGSTGDLFISKNTPSGKYLEFLKQSYDFHKGNVDSTQKIVEKQALGYFNAYLDDEIKTNSSAPHKAALKVVLYNSTLKFNNAVSSIQLASGKISAEQDLQNRSRDSQIAQSATISDLPSLNSTECNLANGNLIGCIDTFIAHLIKVTLLQFAGFLLWVFANTLNLVIQVGIFGFSEFLSPSIYQVWVVIRTIVSFFVVLSMFWLLGAYMIGREQKFARYLAWFLLYALFVNFSYKASSLPVDLSNIITLNIYTSTFGTNVITSDISSDAWTLGRNTPGAIIMDRMGLHGLVASAGKTDGVSLTSINSTPGALLAVAFTLYAAFVFFMLTILLAVRTGLLIIIIVASPILFVDSVVPKLGSFAANMRKIYFGQLAVAPVFAIMLALTLKFLQIFQAGPLKSPSENTVVMIFSILMMIIMLHIMLRVIKELSGQAGEMATKFMGTVGGFGLGVASGGAGLLARGTIGRGAAALRDSKWITNNQDNFFGRHAYNMTNALSGSTFDARNSDFISKKMTSAGMGMGSGGKMGYDQQLKATTEDRMARYGRIKTENDDGTVNQAGVDAKQRFYSSAGGVGVLVDKKSVRRALFEKDLDEATTDKKKLDYYDKAVGEKKQDYLFKTENPGLRRMMEAQDRGKADRSNELIDIYNNSNIQQERASALASSSPNEQDHLIGKDMTAAERQNKILDYQNQNAKDRIKADRSVQLGRQSTYNNATDEDKKLYEDVDRQGAESINISRNVHGGASQETKSSIERDASEQAYKDEQVRTSLGKNTSAIRDIRGAENARKEVQIKEEDAGGTTQNQAVLKNHTADLHAVLRRILSKQESPVTSTGLNTEPERKAA